MFMMLLLLLMMRMMIKNYFLYSLKTKEKIKFLSELLLQNYCTFETTEIIKSLFF
jgi:hypothetical protein